MKIAYYCDMDGVLARWNEKATQEEVQARGYFINREPEDSAIELVKILNEREGNVHILSSVYEDDHSKDEKIQWNALQGLHKIDQIYVPYGADKNDYIQWDEGTIQVLIDDFKNNLESWRNAGGLAIKFHNGINNRSKLEISHGGNVKVKTDSWTGFTINHKMSAEEMYIAVTGVAKLTAGWTFQQAG